MDLGEKLRMIRKKIHGMTLAEVSKTTSLSVSFLSDVERGRTRPSLNSLKKLAACYEITINDLLEDVKFDDTRTKIDKYPPSFQEFIKEHKELDEEIIELLLQVEKRAKRKAKTKDDWLQYYYSLKSILGK